MDSMPVTNNAAGEPVHTEDKVLETGASIIQVFLTELKFFNEDPANMK